MTDPSTTRPSTSRPSTSVLAVIPIVLFIPSLVSFAVSKPGVVWPEYTGVFFHLAILLLIDRLNAQSWAKAAGYGWIILDVLTGILSINGVAYDITGPVRLGGHVLAGVWLVTTSHHQRQRPVQIIGVLTGLWLGSYSFIAPNVPEYALYPASLLIIAWFVLLAVTNPTHYNHRHTMISPNKS